MGGEEYPVVRGLDGIYYRAERDGKKCSLSFTDLTDAEQQCILEHYDKEALLRMCKLLARDLRKLGDQLDIVSGDECENDDE